MAHSGSKRSTVNRAGGGVTMQEIIINAIIARIQAGQMTIEQVPIPYREQVLAAMEGDDQ